MKSLVLIAICFFSLQLSAQGNLQFNQVKMISTSETVPVGKVWKIESAVLSLKDGIRVAPTFMIDQDTVLLGYESYETSELENVVSVDIQWLGINNKSGPASTCGCCCTSNLPANGSINVNLNIGGIGSGSNIINENLSFNDVPSGSSGTYISLGNAGLSSAGNNVISNWTISYKPLTTQPCLPTYTTSVWGTEYTFRITFLLANGNAKSYIVSQSQFGCGASPTLSIANPTISSETRTRPQVTTKFPIWISEGSQVQTLSNISKLSVIEFNVVP